jgi:DNA invertase Pin-like site-specific DNA recombinase
MLDLIYARTSKDVDDAFSVESQVKVAVLYNARRGVSVPDEYIFREDYSGFVLDHPELNKVRRLIREGQVRSITVHQVDRVARKSHIAQYLLQEEILPSNVELHIVAWGRKVENTPQDIAFYGIQAEFAQMERSNFVQRARSGKEEKQAQGIWIGQGIDKYGFYKTGKRRETRLNIKEDEAQIVLFIFQNFVRLRLRQAGGSAAWSVAGMLDEQKTLTPSQAKGFHMQRPKWSAAMIYSILRDEVYIGRFYFNKWATTVSKNGKKSTALRPREEWQLADYSELRIVPFDLWEQAQVLLDTGKGTQQPRKHLYLLNGRLRCGLCKHSISSNSTLTDGKYYQYYVCGGRSNSRALFVTDEDRCTLPRVPIANVDSIMWNWVCELGNNPEAVLAGYQKIQKAQLEHHQEAIDAVAHAQYIIERWQRSIKNYAEMYDGEIITWEALKEKKAEADKHIAQARTIIAEYEQKVEQGVISDAEIAHRVEFTAKMKEAAGTLEGLELAERKHVIQLMNITGIIGIDTNRVYIDIYWHNEYQDRFYVDSPNSKGWRYSRARAC